MSQVGDKVELQKQTVEVVDCENCQHDMVNIDADQIAEGDLLTLKRLSLRLSNPETEDPICLNCEIEKQPTFKEKVSEWFDSSSDDDSDDDSSFFSGGTFGGSSSGGGFGGFGGGSFSGGGASGSF